MESKTVVILALFVLASTICLPAMDADTSESELFTYYSQLDPNEAAVYEEVCSARTIIDASQTFRVDFGQKVLFDEPSLATAYAERAVNNGLSALYLSDPMIPYVWDYPVTDVKVTAEVVLWPDLPEEQGVESYYIVKSVEFTLSVPEGITADSMKELNDALDAIKINGNSDAEKVINIMNVFNTAVFQKDGEGEISNIYDALVTKRTTSAGVAQAFVEICNKNSITAITVAGQSLLAKEEAQSFWNYVYLEGDIGGQTMRSWYIVDPTYASAAGICGYSTEITFENKVYSMAGTHNTDLRIISGNTLSVPQIEANKYVPVGGVPFFEKYGEMIIIGAIGAVLVLGMVYAVRSGNF